MVPTPSQVGERIQHVRKDMGFAISDLASLAELGEDVLRATEDGRHQLRPRDLIAVARALHWDWEAFLEPQDGFGERILTLFRQNGQLTPQDRLNLADLAARAGALPKLATQLRPALAPIKPPNDSFIRRSGRAVALKLRTMLGLGHRPLDNPFELLRHYGVQLFRVDFSTPKLSGVTFVHSNFGAAVVVRKQDDLYRQCFSAMHEWGHVLMDNEEHALVSFENARNDIREPRANGFAAGMLLPDGVLKPKWTELGENWNAWHQVLVDYRASYGTLFYALFDAECISSAKLKTLFGTDGRPRVQRDLKFDPDNNWVSRGGLERLELCSRLGVSPELADAAIASLRGADPPSWAWVAEQLRLSMDELRDLVSQPPHNLKQPLPANVNHHAF